jgi:hypothetical protein
MSKPPKIRGDGGVDGRGYAEGSVPTRFAPGDGRKRPGRTKGAKSLTTIYREIAKMPLALELAGKKTKITTAQGIILKLREKALKGDQRAAELLLDKIEAHCPVEARPDLTAQLLDEDVELLAGAQARALPPPLEGDGGKEA